MTKQIGASNDGGSARSISSAWIVGAAVLCMLTGISSLQEALDPATPAQLSAEREGQPGTALKVGRYGSV